jgi:hypothetical protein
MLEERRQRVLESLRDLAAQLQDALVEPPRSRVRQKGSWTRTRSNAANRASPFERLEAQPKTDPALHHVVTGSSTTNLAPSPASDSTRSRPPIRSVSSREMYRPSPVPPAARVVCGPDR